MDDLFRVKIMRKTLGPSYVILIF